MIAKRDSMVEKLKLTTANLEKISEKLKNTSNKCMGIVECKQAPSSFYSRHNNDENEADTFGNKIHAASCRKANFNAETDPAKIFVKQLLRLPVSELKEKDENFSAWTATIADLRGDNPIKLTKKTDDIAISPCASNSYKYFIGLVNERISSVLPQGAT